MITNEICDELLKYAKLSPSSFHKVIETVTFGQDFRKENYAIFKGNKEVIKALEEIQPNDEPINLSIKGTDNDQAVLCTNDRTYEISESETSNTLLILPNLEISAFENYKTVEEFTVLEFGVLSSCNKIFDLKERNAKIGEVFKALQDSIFHHHIDDENVNCAFTFEKLLKIVLMSESELKNILEKLKVFRFDNSYVRLLHVDYLSKVIASIMDCALENDYDMYSISQKNLHLNLDSLYPDYIIDQTLKFYFSPISKQDDDVIWEVNGVEIANCFSEQILNNCGIIGVEEFMTEWRKKVPEEIEVSLSSLVGRVIVTDNGSRSTIKLLIAWSLPDEPESRFRELFTHKSHWTEADLVAYVEDIVPRNGSAKQLLVQYCRCSTLGSTKLFSKR